MAELQPIAFDRLIRRAFRELDDHRAVFDLPERRWFLGDPTRDLGCDLFGHRAASPFGAAAGPHTQLAQNLVLGWLAGLRVFELKTVQVRDDLAIARPCIDARNLGFNVEWSQELPLEQSLEEYAKGALLIRLLQASGKVPILPGFGDVVLDTSVGYDLAGIQSPGVQRFLDGMRDARPILDRLRAQIPREYGHLRDVPLDPCLSDTVTLSTFHGCPPDEIEAIADFLLRQRGLHTVVKLNPTLLGREDLRGILHDRLSFTDLQVPDEAFAHDTTWPQAVGLVTRLQATARDLGRGFGVKLSNTLIVQNDRGVLPASEPRMYLSGPPLHVLAMTLVQRFRERFGPGLPLSFSAGIDKGNAAQAVALGLRPVTMCTDLLKPGGYGRAQAYGQALGRAMAEVGAVDLATWTVRGLGQGPAALDDLGLDVATWTRCRQALDQQGDLRAAAGERWPDWQAAALVRNTAAYVAGLGEDPRYHALQHRAVPKKVGSHLDLFDCLACDLCVPVCPNDANFKFPLAPAQVATARLLPTASGWKAEPSETLRISRRHQIARFADACNDCGNCDAFCPEDGGPNRVKPAVFSSLQAWRERPDRDGLCVEPLPGGGRRLHGRLGGVEYAAEMADGRVRYTGPGFDLVLDPACLEGDIPSRVEGLADSPVELRWLVVLHWLGRGIDDARAVHFANA